jgi:hypothetical protein
MNGQSSDQNYFAYIEKFHQIAIRQQKAHGIPASIILAQGLLESAAGRSRLTVEANNHFGIKCHNWDGDKIYHDDDEKNECFRKYRHAEESYEDHSLFLISRPRYQSLFQLKSSDYAGWAYGLKAAGYATDPGYAQKLISIIERYNLHQYDATKLSIFSSKEEQSRTKEYQSAQKNTREVFKSNYIKMIVSTDSDSYASIAATFDISEKNVRKYNDVGEDAVLKKGSIVYLAKKKKRAALANPVHVVQSGETLYGISQVYGIQLISLYKLNNLAFNEGAQIGQIIKLR